MPELPKLTKGGRTLIAVLGAVILLLILGNVYVNQYTDLLWFRSVDYSSVFSRRLITEILLFLVFGALMAIIVAGNVVIAYRLRPPFRPVSAEQEQLERYRTMIKPARGWILAAVVTLIGIITGASASQRWETWLLWRNGQSFHHTDPQFHKDVSYFAFTYPMQRFVLGTLFAIVIVSLIAVLATSYLYGSLRVQTPGPKWTPAGRVHVSVLLGVLLLLKAIAYWLDRYGLAFSGRGIVTGPSYTDVHAVLPAKTILVFVAIICALLFFANIYTRNWTLPAVSFGLMVLAAIVIGGVYPALVQHFKVSPSAQDLESPYINRNIIETRYAYELNFDGSDKNVTVDAGYQGVAPAGTTGKALLADTRSAAQVRVLDPNVVSQTFDQLQQQRSFYSFPGTLDVDRYSIDGKLADVVIGTRDIDLSGLQTDQRNWINQHLIYTHGYGVVAARADTADAKGSPDFIEKDLPPTGPLALAPPESPNAPRIYFGENSPLYSIVGAPSTAKDRELDYPTDTGTGQASNTYDQNGGIPVGSFWHQLMFAWKYRDKNILLSSGVNADSRLLSVRDPRARVQKVAPWLTLDGDSYPVVLNDQILWVVDGYTTTSGFPYSEQQSLGSTTKTSLTGGASVAAQNNRNINYIRNSVKATVNASTGQVEIYAWDQAPTTETPDGHPDPVLQTWEKAFPGVVQPQSAMPAGLTDHLRYPEDLFNIQRTLLAHYHVSDPHSFYNGNGFWNVPYDPTVDSKLTATKRPAVQQPAYYFTMSPDGGTTAPTFSLTSPLVSLNRRNLTAFLSVNSQPGPGYGHFEMLEVPSNQVTAGPLQVQNAIESTTAVSTQLSLLRQGGSRVTLGNLLTIPVDGTFVYVEPIYVQSAGTGAFPELRQIATYYNGSVGYQPTLEAALTSVFGAKGGSSPPSEPPNGGNKPPKSTTKTLSQVIADAQAAERAADKALKRGDLAAYAAQQKRVQRDLNRIAALLNSQTHAFPAATATPTPTATSTVGVTPPTTSTTSPPG